MAITNQTPGSVGVRNVSGGAQAGGVFFDNAAAPNPVVSDFIQWTQGVQAVTLFDVDAFSRTHFIGRSVPGAMTADAAWQIIEFIYDAATSKANLIEMRLPVKAGEPAGTPASAAFVHVWNDRATLDFPDPNN